MNLDKKVATRASYGEALAKIGEANEKIVVLDADLAEATKRVYLEKSFRKGFLIWEFQNKI